MSGLPDRLRTDVQITLVQGNVDRLKQEAVRTLAAAWLGEELQYGLSTVDAGEVGLGGVLAELSSGSLIAGRRLVVVRDLTSLSKREQQELARALGSLPPDTAVVLWVAKEQWDGRSRGAELSGSGALSEPLNRLVQTTGQVLSICAPPLRQLPGWVMAQMTALGKDLDAGAAHLLVETAGEDPDRLLSEMDKLAAYVGERPRVTTADVQAVCVATAEERMWEFLDAVGERNSARALGLLDGMLPPGSDKGAAIMLIGSIARQLRLLWQVRLLYLLRVLPGNLDHVSAAVAAKLPAQQSILDAVRGRPWLLGKFSDQARRFSDRDLARALDRVYQADLQLKGLGPRHDDRTIVELLVVELCERDRDQS